jgi:hypothetical protein
VPTEWLIYAGPSLHSECVPPAKVSFDDKVADLLDDSDPDAWRVLIATLEALGCVSLPQGMSMSVTPHAVSAVTRLS